MKKPAKKHIPAPARAPARTSPHVERQSAPTIAEELNGTAFPSLRLKHPLQEIFDEALGQATRGKGSLRHGRGRDSTDAKNFMAQDWRAIAQRHGPAFLSGQAEKKLREALELPNGERRTELLGVLVYTAMLIIHHDKAALGQ